MRHAFLRSVVSCAFAGAILLACATVRPGPRHTAPDGRFGWSDRITADDIAPIAVTTAFEAVQRLRPQFLRWTRGAARSHALVVYVDGMRAGGIEQLRQIPAWGVREIRHLSAREATARYGSGHTVGALLVVMGERRR